jgi:hypothetical protein
MSENMGIGGYAEAMRGNLRNWLRRIAGWGAGGLFIGALFAPMTGGWSLGVGVGGGILYGALKK